MVANGPENSHNPRSKEQQRPMRSHRTSSAQSATPEQGSETHFVDRFYAEVSEAA